MEINYHDLGLHKNYLYEVLTTTFSKSQKRIIPNTASMGIRLLNDGMIKITPYPNTTTFKNLNENGIAVFNFVDNIYLYALASLKESNSLIGLTEFPNELYEYYDIPLNTNLKEILSNHKDDK